MAASYFCLEKTNSQGPIFARLTLKALSLNHIQDMPAVNLVYDASLAIKVMEHCKKNNQS